MDKLRFDHIRATTEGGPEGVGPAACFVDPITGAREPAVTTFHPWCPLGLTCDICESYPTLAHHRPGRKG